MSSDVLALDTDYMKAGFGLRYDSDGTVWAQCVAHTDLVKNTPYLVIVNEYGPVSLALGVARGYVGVPDRAVTSGAVAWLQIGGYIAALITASLDVQAGHALKINSGAVADVGADYAGAAENFAVHIADDGGTSATTHAVILVPDKITAS